MDIKLYENMAKLDLPEDQRRELKSRADALLQSFSALDEIDTGGAQPVVSVLDTRNILREDTPRKAITRDELLAHAPEQQDGYFRVPRTLD
ncbi:MAG: Asp-tRNA(Asn)/Glu-tRNA(Gln) amidotransferase subunit GatC [Oscillospiraceae bacterium]|nr:Asp-tRNA(Asn)/Glu-tRNA(Gln) amidotransferase subunit GatC [Oscillospiraceae bacterium]